MPRSSGTVGTVATQLALLRQEFDEQKSLLLDTLRQMLLISQVQAETTRELTRAVQAIVTVPSVQGGGSSRTLDEETELRMWREERDQAAAAERPERTIGAGITDPSGDW